MNGEPRRVRIRDRWNHDIEIPVRPGLPVTAPQARYPGFKQQTLILEEGTVRMKGAMPLPCDILLETDVPVTLRDGTTIYTDVFRPVEGHDHPAILALSPYGKQIGSQWLDDVPMRAGVPKKATSGLQKFEGPDPAYWVRHGYAVVNPDVRGAYMSEGIVKFFGSEYGRDGSDLVEWAARQSWCNGRVGMSGNSWLAISQWFVAAEQPEHLAAIAPWEGLYDSYREVATRGGVMMPEFVDFLMRSFASTPDGGVEDSVAAMRENPTMNAYWRDKIADLESIIVPAYVVASYTNPIHTDGSFDGFHRISSTDKWLRVHNTGEWDDYYEPSHVEDLRRFFDHFLKGIDNGWETTPRIRLSVLNPGGRDIVDRIEDAFPPARTRHRRLYLDPAAGRLSEHPVDAEGECGYDSDAARPHVSFDFTIGEDMEMLGYPKLRLWVQAPDHDDLDLEVTVEKLSRFGRKYPSPMLKVASQGHMRVSLRELDPELSTESRPYQTMEHEQRLADGEIVPVEIPLRPIGIAFRKGQRLRLTVAAYKSPKSGSVAIPFGKKTISVPAEGFTYKPGSRVKMIKLGEGAQQAVKETPQVELPRDHNHGRHILHAGGRYDSHLLIPVSNPR